MVSVLVQYKVNQSIHICIPWFDLQPYVYPVGIKVVKVALVQVRAFECYIRVGAPSRLWEF